MWQSEEGGGSGAVSSVNTKTGTVALTAADVGAAPAPYTIGAVHFDGANSSLVTAALTCTDSANISFAFRYRTTAFQEAPQIFAADPESDYTASIQMSTLNAITTFFNSAGRVETFSVDTAAKNGDSVWHSVIGSVNLNAAAGLKVQDIVIDGLHAGYSGVVDASAAFIPALSGRSFYLGDDAQGDGAMFDIADFWFAPGQSLLVDGLIPLATIRKFTDANGKPVNLGVNGELPTGTAPAIFFHATVGSEVATFPVNRGTGGSFALVGTITAATHSPSETPDIGFANPMTAAGDMMIGGANGAATRLAVGTEGQVLKMVSGVPTWATP